jgi:hypothetical protein
MFLGLDIGRQYVKMVSVEKIKEGYKILDAGSRLIPEPNSAFDPEKNRSDALGYGSKRTF